MNLFTCLSFKIILKKGKKNMKRKAFTLVVALSTMLLFSTVVFAAAASFTATLPAYQGDTEVSKVRRESSTTSVFRITIDSISDGFSSACAWTETVAGANLSSPYNQASKGSSHVYSYSTIPSQGTNVVLNLDNPVSTPVRPIAKGTWNPF
jgi:hypothetical protein